MTNDGGADGQDEDYGDVEQHPDHQNPIRQHLLRPSRPILPAKGGVRMSCDVIEGLLYLGMRFAHLGLTESQ